MIVTENDVEECLNLLADTAQEYGKLCEAVEVGKKREKKLQALEFLNSKDKTNAAKEARALISISYEQFLEQYSDNYSRYQILKTQRQVAEIKIEVWRTESANMRRGHV